MLTNYTKRAKPRPLHLSKKSPSHMKKVILNRQQSVKTDYLRVLLGVPRPSRLKSKFTSVLEGLISFFTPKVRLQHSHDESSLVAARIPLKRLSRTLYVELKNSKIFSVA
jgi:hypothetical protein